MSESEQLSFQQLALSEPILKALNDVGYETPSPIQAETIPLLLSGRDVLGQAQTGTGKTAAFALPALSNIDISQRDPQILVLAPTRELAIRSPRLSTNTQSTSKALTYCLFTADKNTAAKSARLNAAFTR